MFRRIKKKMTNRGFIDFALNEWLSPSPEAAKSQVPHSLFSLSLWERVGAKRRVRVNRVFRCHSVSGKTRSHRHSCLSNSSLKQFKTGKNACLYFWENPRLGGDKSLNTSPPLGS